ncbi:MAG TPA: hypothetical protein VLI69_02225 [Gammaproteobacteria bacterium]|nr:hypothetical protein [Gammaproteobacteria bacterium]
MKKTTTSSVLAMNLIILVLGMVLLTQFYTLLFQQTFSVSGWPNYLNNLMQYNEAGSFKYKIIIFLKNTSPYSAYLFAAGLFISALTCIMLMARFYICIAVAVGFFIAWTLIWNDPGMWPFEFAFPAIFGLLAGLSMRNYSLAPQSIFLQLKYSPEKTFLCLILSSALLYYVTFIAFPKSDFAWHIAFASALSFFIFCLVPFFMKLKNKKNNLEKDKMGHVDKYLDFMIIIIGSMLILQVYINYFSGVFDINNFRENLTYFAKNTNAIWLRSTLTLNADYSQWILPIYMIFESCLSIGVTLLLIRGPILLVAGGLFCLLAFAELGVSSTWPPDPKNLTWEWELLFVTAVAFIIGIQKTLKLKENFSLKKLVMGEPLGNHHPISLIANITISIICGMMLYLIALTAHFFIGDSYWVTAKYSGISFAVLIFILLSTNRLRK